MSTKRRAAMAAVALLLLMSSSFTHAEEGWKVGSWMLQEADALLLDNDPRTKEEGRGFSLTVKHPGDGGFEKELITPDPPAKLEIECGRSHHGGGIEYSLWFEDYKDEADSPTAREVPIDVVIDGHERLALRFHQDGGSMPGLSGISPVPDEVLMAIGRATRSITVVSKVRSVTFGALRSGEAIEVLRRNCR